MPVEFLWGDEDYLIEVAIDKMKKNILGDDINPLNYRSVDNPSFSLFSELLRTNAMMFGDSVIQIKCPKYFLNSKGEQKLDDKQVTELVSALNNVSDRVHIILVCPTPRGERKKPDSRKKLFKELQKITKPQEFPAYRNYEEYKIIPILSKMASEKELKLARKEASFLIQTTGASLRDLASQLEKLKLYAYPNNIITMDMIKEIAINNADIMTIADLILEKKYSQALNLISEVLQKEHYLPTLALIQTMFSNLVKTKLYCNMLSSFEIASKLNQNEYIVKMNIQKLKNIALDELIRLKINLETIEYLLKTGSLKDPILAYEMAFAGGNL
ncbi:MAG: DNA polymerase III subunit delta [Candidatus Gastranaerophilales bacterium]|nr:DNA polymerase III subunit delta [Candidatus Gastranaerophilales bacterium]